MSNPYQEPLQPAFSPYLTGPLELVTPTSGLAVGMEEAKLRLRVEVDDDNANLEGIIAAAQAHCEREISGHRQFLYATYDLPVACWWDGPLKLPRPPLSSVTWIRYYDTAGTLQTLSSSLYLVRTPWRMPGTIERAPGASFPAYQSDRRLPISIRLVAGYGASFAAIPPTVKQAILLLAKHWYDHPDAVAIGTISGSMQFSLAALLEGEGYGG